MIRGWTIACFSHGQLARALGSRRKWVGDDSSQLHFSQSSVSKMHGGQSFFHVGSFIIAHDVHVTQLVLDVHIPLYPLPSSVSLSIFAYYCSSLRRPKPMEDPPLRIHRPNELKSIPRPCDYVDMICGRWPDSSHAWEAGDGIFSVKASLI